MSAGMPAARSGSVLVVDLSSSGLVVATRAGAVELTPTVATVSDLGGGRGTARVECSDRVDAYAADRPDRCLLDPCAWIDRARAPVGGLSVPTTEVLAAPVARAVTRSASPADRLVLLVPSHWGSARVRRVQAAAARVRPVAGTVRSALATALALSASAARRIVCVEGERSGWVLTLVGADGGEFVVLDRRYVPVLDPVVDRPADIPVRRVVAEIAGLRAGDPAARTGSFEVLARGREAGALVDLCDRARIPATLVPPGTAAASAVLLAPVS